MLADIFCNLHHQIPKTPFNRAGLKDVLEMDFRIVTFFPWMFVTFTPVHRA